MKSFFTPTHFLTHHIRSTRHNRNFHSSIFRGFPRVAKGDAPIKVTDRLSEFRRELFRKDPGYKLFRDEVPRPTIWRQVLFTVGVSTVFYGVCAYTTDVETEYWKRKLTGVAWWTQSPSSGEMRYAQNVELAKVLQGHLDAMRDALNSAPVAISNLFLLAYAGVAKAYLGASESKRVAWQIVALNGVVFLMWHIPRFKPFMLTRFAHDPLSGRSVTLLTSVFSHVDLWHFVFNSMALASFGSASIVYLVTEQDKNKAGLRESTPYYHFWGFFVAAGLFASLSSHITSAKLKFPLLLRQIRAGAAAAAKTTASAAEAASRSLGASAASKIPKIPPSLGASGAIYASVTLTALAFPDASVSLIFFPFLPFPISYGVGSMLLLDITGILRGWQLFDHWAHLGGAAFGVFYYFYGATIWDAARQIFYKKTRRVDS